MSPTRTRCVSTVILITLAGLLASGCGGGGSVSGPSGGSGGATAMLQGQVVAGQGAGSEPAVLVAGRSGVALAVAEAAVVGSPVAGATVNLLNGTTLVATTTTDASGQFSFRNVAPGTYTIQVLQNGSVVASVVVTVGADDQAIVGVATNGVSSVQVTALSTDVYNNDAQLGHALNIANASSRCDLVTVTRYRESGLGWGNIAERCGVPAGVIGLGRSNLTDRDLDEARERTGHAPIHGNAGKGNDKDKDKDKDKGKGKS